MIINSKTMSANSKISLLAFGTFGLIVGLVIGYFCNRDSSGRVPEDWKIRDKILNEINAKNIKENLRILTEYPHIAGGDVDEKILVNFVANRFEDAGLEVEVHPYDVLLSYPNKLDSNYVAIKKENGDLVSKSHPSEKILDQSQDKPGVVNPFNAYSPPGEPEGELLFVNYGRIEDFQAISKLGINITSKICIARYSRIFRGDKVIHAEKYKCAGLILYSDPEDYAVPGAGVYPDSWYLPGTGSQRGTLILEGDPLTVNYPALDTAWRDKVGNADLPRIPVMPIGYDDAILYLGNMSGDEVPVDWRGDLNITYRYGPGFRGVYQKSKVKMHVTTTNQMATVHNVIGTIRGEVEPDRYVMFGNHRDAWVFGAIDPSSGTAAMLEIARVYGKAVEEGWRPRRTIVFCSWGAEEYGLIGSTEWVEEFQKILSSRAVAYLNVDIAVQGNYTMEADSVPNLVKLIHESAALVPNPDLKEIELGRKTVYDTWKAKKPSTNGYGPNVGSLGSGSDYTMFLQVTGVTALDIRYTYDKKPNMGFYPVYHSVYETFDLMKTYIDPEFKYHQSVARLWGEIGRRLIDNPILPLNCVDYASKLIEEKKLLTDAFGKDMAKHGIDLSQLNRTMRIFEMEAKSLHERIEDLDTTNKEALRAINDQLMFLDRAFIDLNGIEGRKQYRHVIYAPSLHNNYASSAFPGLLDSMFDIDADPDQDRRWDEV